MPHVPPASRWPYAAPAGGCGPQACPAEHPATTWARRFGSGYPPTGYSAAPPLATWSPYGPPTPAYTPYPAPALWGGVPPEWMELQSQCRGIADEFSQQFGGLPIQLQVIAQTPNSAAAVTEHPPDNRGRIWVAAWHPRRGIPFSIAHECGHVLQMAAGTKARAWGEDKPCELEATKIAGRFLRLTGRPVEEGVAFLQSAGSSRSHGTVDEQVAALLEGYQDPDGAWWEPYRHRYEPLPS